MTMTNWQRVEPLIDVTEEELAPGAGCGASERPGPVTDRHTNTPFST